MRRVVHASAWVFVGSLATLAGGAFQACSSENPDAPVGSGETLDAVAQADAMPSGEGGEAGTFAPDASADAGPGVQYAYTDLRDASAWTTYSLQAVNASATGFFGGTFDGRYLYFAPMRTPAAAYHGLVVRFDTKAAFASASSWSTFDLSSLDGNARGYPGSVFDGKYVYFVPRANETVAHGLAVRFDTTASFASASSWAIFDIRTLHADARGFQGAVFDGRYVYYVPFINYATSGLVARYDTTGLFSAAGSWSFFDVTDVNANAKVFSGGVFDGRYVYLVPYAAGGYSGTIVRYDTQAAFGAAGSWTAFDLTTIDGALRGYVGGVFDGRYVYLAPNYDGSAYSGTVPRYDTQAPFSSASSWTRFDATSVDPKARGYHHAGFDGRYVYFSPSTDGTAPSGRILRYDTERGFSAASSWSVFDLATVNTDAVGFTGTIFDGRFLYLVPNSGTTVARFDAKVPPGLPALKGSYY